MTRTFTGGSSSKDKETADHCPSPVSSGLASLQESYSAKNEVTANIEVLADVQEPDEVEMMEIDEVLASVSEIRSDWNAGEQRGHPTSSFSG